MVFEPGPLGDLQSTDQRMHRITSADALFSTAAASAAATSAPDLALPPTVPEFAEHAEDYEQGDQDAWDDVPLLQPSHKSKHTFNVSALNPAQRNHQHTSTAWREAVASLRLAAPVTVQVSHARCGFASTLLSCSSRQSPNLLTFW